ncbi:uncharacterized protein LOC129402109 isoform X2 [Sorex araneus]|uniref:uncharacterized protein LOC129402109 isoform X2 n=1 Tax=Sorex araneus TaxID=42254 RepID=UPI002433A3CF|nr:uncharacterized protein LOC129402109 isoform X2 [Sorex araneus]
MRGDPTLDSAKGKTLSPGTRTSLAKQPDCPLPGREGVSGCRPGGRGGGLHRRDQVSRAPKTAMCPGAAAAARKAGLRNPRGALGPRPRTPRTDPRVGPRCPRWTQEAAVGGRDLRGKAPRCRLKAPECIDSKVTAALLRSPPKQPLGCCCHSGPRHGLSRLLLTPGPSLLLSGPTQNWSSTTHFSPFFFLQGFI